MFGEVITWQAADGYTDALRLGWVQMNLHWEDLAANITYLESLWAKVGSQAEVWVLPEMWSTGFSVSERAAEDEPGPALQAMRTWAQSYKALFIGSLKVRTPTGHLHNRAYVVSPTGEWAYYDKRHLFRMAGEEKIFTAGANRLITHYKGWRIVVLICYDLRFPVWSRRSEAYDYDLLIYVANWPAARAAHWEKLLPARAIENQAYVLGVNRVGTDGTGKAYLGGSVLYSAVGQVILHSGGSEGVFWATLSKESLEAYRRAFPAWMDRDAFQIK
jgi:predicted amidohydrolase